MLVAFELFSEVRIEGDHRVELNEFKIISYYCSRKLLSPTDEASYMNLTFHKFLDSVVKSSGARKKSVMLPGLVHINLPRASRPIMNPRLHRNGNRSKSYKFV